MNLTLELVRDTFCDRGEVDPLEQGPSRRVRERDAADTRHREDRARRAHRRLPNRNGVQIVSTWTVLQGDNRASLASMPERSVRCCVTSPPYFGLRDYGHDGQIGLEPTPAEYVAKMVAVFREVRRVLRDDGTLWLNLGDSYAANGVSGLSIKGESSTLAGPANVAHTAQRKMVPDGLKPKDLVGIPWRVAFALQADGWYLRSDIIWHKPNPMPESVTDRPTKSHEYLFLLAKSKRYYYDAKAIAEDCVRGDAGSSFVSEYDMVTKPGLGTAPRAKRMPPIGGIKKAGGDNATYSGNQPEFGTTRNKRDVWTIPTQPYSGAHFATFPEALAEPCILAGSAVGDTVLDPFSGSGTTGAVAVRHGRNYIGCELNPAYVKLSHERIGKEAPLFVAGCPHTTPKEQSETPSTKEHK